ncbi:hypothetical protein [Prochlorococcus sp. MIT 1011]|uniref:hypothetical protein n=1 Tax=Prochlorococcus sp. MIT 1011 TaxID=3082520 RepID=UPI0039B61D8F
MKSFFSYAIAFLFIFIALSSQVHGFQNESILDKSQIIIANKYAERFCSAKADHFFEGLDNEKTLKYSYFQYIGLMSDEVVLRGMYKPLINQIREKCIINDQEEREVEEFFLKGPAFKD